MTRRRRGMTFIEVIMSMSILSLIMVLVFNLTTMSNTALVTTFKADNYAYTANYVLDTVRFLCKSATEVRRSPEGNFHIRVGTETHELKINLGTLELDGESLCAATRLEIDNLAPMLIITIESEELLLQPFTVAMEGLL